MISCARICGAFGRTHRDPASDYLKASEKITLRNVW